MCGDAWDDSQGIGILRSGSEKGANQACKRYWSVAGTRGAAVVVVPPNQRTVGLQHASAERRRKRGRGAWGSSCTQREPAAVGLACRWAWSGLVWQEAKRRSRTEDAQRSGCGQPSPYTVASPLCNQSRARNLGIGSKIPYFQKHRGPGDNQGARGSTPGWYLGGCKCNTQPLYYTWKASFEARVGRGPMIPLGRSQCQLRLARRIAARIAAPAETARTQLWELPTTHCQSSGTRGWASTSYRERHQALDTLSRMIL